MTRYRFLGLPLDACSQEDSIQALDEQVANRTFRQHMVINAFIVTLAKRNPALREAIEASSMVQADGQAVVWAARLLGLPIPERVAGIDLMGRVLEHCALKGYRVFLLGAEENVVKTCLANIHEAFPKLQVAGYRNGYFGKDEDLAVADAIREARTDVLFVGMPSPRKELFIHQFQERMGVPFALGVGGSFDVFAGLVKRAPKLVQKIGMEWCFRLLQEPRRLWKRYLVTNSEFIALVLRDLFISGFSKKKTL